MWRCISPWRIHFYSLLTESLALCNTVANLLSHFTQTTIFRKLLWGEDRRKGKAQHSSADRQ